MYDPYNYDRAQRRYYRDRRRYYHYRNPLRGLGTGLFLIALVIAFALHDSLGGIGFLPIFFVGLAFLSLFGSMSTLNRHGIYGGLNGFVWLLGLALCFWIGFWPWILLPVAATMILGSLYRPMIAGLSNIGFVPVSQMQQQPYQQPVGAQTYPPQEQPEYQQGYQAVPQQPVYSQEPKQQHEQPQAQYPEQELPPMQQG